VFGLFEDMYDMCLDYLKDDKFFHFLS